MGGWTACGLAVSNWKQQKRRTAQLGGPAGEQEGGGGGQIRGVTVRAQSVLGSGVGSVGLGPTREEGV